MFHVLLTYHTTGHPNTVIIIFFNILLNPFVKSSFLLFNASFAITVLLLHPYSLFHLSQSSSSPFNVYFLFLSTLKLGLDVTNNYVGFDFGFGLWPLIFRVECPSNSVRSISDLNISMDSLQTLDITESMVVKTVSSFKEHKSPGTDGTNLNVCN